MNSPYDTDMIPVLLTKSLNTLAPEQGLLSELFMAVNAFYAANRQISMAPHITEILTCMHEGMHTVFYNHREMLGRAIALIERDEAASDVTVYQVLIQCDQALRRK